MSKLQSADRDHELIHNCLALLMGIELSGYFVVGNKNVGHVWKYTPLK